MTSVRVLYLEDSETDAALVEALLLEGGIGCSLTRVETAEAFAAALEEGGFHIILSDHTLPSYDSLSALACARERCPDVPFVFVSGTLGEEAAIESLKAGATDYVLKQRLSRLVPAIKRAIAEAAARAASKRHAERVHQLAFYDQITGLPNRALLEDRLRTALARASRAAEGVAVLFMDLDRFKAVNDSLGHPAGDALLREVAERLPRCLREADTAARWGGDEFIALIPDLPGGREAAAEAVAVVIEKVHAALAKPALVEGQEVEVSTSIGVTLYPWDGSNVTDLMKRADTAMYQAKDRGGNTYQFFTQAMDAAARERLFLDNELRRALRRGELTLHYQPQIDARDHRIVGAEALLRWKHRERGWIAPAKFIPVAEETGQIQVIGHWVIEEALRQINDWRGLGLTVPRISVNVSPRQLTEPRFPRAVADLLAKLGLSPQCLEMELTEGAMVEEKTVATVRALSELGVRLAIDDFGTGYSSLGYLKRFYLDTLKVDQSFVHEMESDPRTAALVKAITAMARSLRLRVVAEGVETEAQRALLSRYGCHQHQGFLFSPALPAEELALRLGAPGRAWAPVTRWA
ncbi:MAG: putative bifunctional diguanylate cyclase/phosphodiesterase [Gammaproteobacteria bacterium]